MVMIAAGQLKFSTDPAGLAQADFIVIAVPTPLDSARNPDFAPLIRASESVGARLRPHIRQTRSKGQTQEMVKRLLNLPGLPSPDTADALGLAITHAYSNKAMARLALVDRVIGAGEGKYKAGRSR